MVTVRMIRSDAMLERLPADAGVELEVGTFDSVQLTYNMLRGPDDERLAAFDHDVDAWVTGDGARWSDVVIFPEGGDRR